MATVSGVREQLVEGGIRILERDGLSALSARKLAAETGTSTMAVYTHFGGMTGVIDAIASEAFARFTRALTEVEQTDDPVADFFVMGAALPRVRAGQSAALPADVRHLVAGSLTGYRPTSPSPATPATVPNWRCHSKRCGTWCAA